MDDEQRADDGGDGIPAEPPLTRGGTWWARPTLISVTALAAMAVLTLATVVQSPSARAGADATPAAKTATLPATAPAATPTSPKVTTPAATPTPTAAPKAAPTASPKPVAPKKKQSPDQAVTAAVAALAADTSGALAVAVTDLSGGGSATYDSAQGDRDHSYDTASIVKVDILAALLLRHQHAGTSLSSEQRKLATEMIESSDNTAATALWDDIGRAAGLDAANRTLGLGHTTGGGGELWGLTQTTAADQLALLRAVFEGSGSPLSSASRAYVTSLMRAVSAGQRWGVSAADTGGGYALKNGWLPRTATGLWDINSIGEVSYEGHTLLICVLSDGRPSEAAGITLAERAALAAAKAYVGAAAGG